MTPRRVLLIVLIASWTTMGLAPAVHAAPAPPNDLAARLGTLRTTLQRAERAESESACLEAISEARTLVDAHPGTLPTQVRKTVEAARSATWPRYARRLLGEARLQVESGEHVLRVRESASAQEEEAAREHLGKTLERSEFTWARQAQGLLKRWGQWLRRLFEGWGTGAEGSWKLDSTWAEVAGRVLIALVVVLLAWLLVLALRSARGLRWREKGDEEAGDAPSEVRVERLPASSEWLQRAALEASRSDYRSAMRCLFMGLLVRLGERGRVRLATGQTNWEIVRQLQGDPDQPELESATRLYESKWYAMRAATVDDLDLLRGHYDHLAPPRESDEAGRRP